jgi:DNA-binding response OmpR family regulator
MISLENNSQLEIGGDSEEVRDFAPGRSCPGSLERKHILVIDDDPQIRRLVAAAVTRAGFLADTARDGEEGWKAICAATYDLVITDHEMPNLSGLSLIERMRTVSNEPPCILISGHLPEPDAVLRALAHRGAVLAKPFSASALIESIFELLLTGGFEGSR